MYCHAQIKCVVEYLKREFDSLLTDFSKLCTILLLNKYLTASKMIQDGNKEATAFLELLESFGTAFVFKI